MHNHEKLPENKVIIERKIVYSRLIIFIIGSIFVLGIFTSFAYYTFFYDDTNNSKTDLTTGNMSLVFSDRDNGINEALELGKTVIKKFTVKNEGSLTGLISFEMNNMINTYTYRSLTYNLEYCKENCNDENAVYTRILEETNMPTSPNPKSYTIANEISVPANTTYFYNLNITLNNTDFDQTADMDAKFITNFAIGEASKYRYYTLQVNPNGGTWNNNTDTQEFKLMTNDTKIIENPTKKGYTFSGWELSGSASKIEGLSFTMGVENSTLTATWNLNKYNVKVIINGEEKTYELGIGDTIELEEPNIEGKIFKGWDITGGTISENTFTLTDDTNVTITADLEDKKYNYTVNHYLMNTDGTTYTLESIDTEETTVGTEVTPGINTYKGFSVPEVKTITISTNPEENKVDYYYTRNQYTLTIDPSEGTYEGNLTQKLYYDETIDLKTASREGYNFSRWKKVSENEAILDENTITMKDSDLTIKAIFTAKTFMLTFNSNGGTSNTESKMITYDATYGDLPTPELDGYEFLGWFSKIDSGDKITSDTVVKVLEDTTLYAHWKQNKVIVTFDANGGEIDTSSKDVVYGQAYGDLPTATKPNLNFAGWFTESSGGTKIETTSIVSTKENHTLYAQYTIKPGIDGTLSIIGKTPKDGDPTFANAATTDETEDGLYSLEDDYGTSYYYRGAVVDNYVKFAGLYWRIIRVNGDGSLRIIYDGDQAYANGTKDANRLAYETEAWNKTYTNDNKYLGYMYGGANGTASKNKTEAQTNETDSNAKDKLEEWYFENIRGIGLDNYIGDNLFCNDRSTAEVAKTWWTSDTTSGYGTTLTAYGSFPRFRTTSNAWNTTNPSPSFKCVLKNDSFTKNDTEKGNANLKEKVGTLTADEIVTAGSGINKSNAKYYLYKGYAYYSLTPILFSSSTSYELSLANTGAFTSYSVNTQAGLDPVINLSPEFVVTLKGTGTATDPFTRSLTEIKVSLDVNGGEPIDTKGFMKEPGDKYGILPEATRKGYVFDGWYTNEETKIEEDIIITEAKNHTLYAHWKPFEDPRAKDILNKLEIIPNETEPNFTKTATTDEGVFVMPDDYGKSYYYRGAVENNYVYFADFYWRIIRVNGDGSLRIIYDGTDKHSNGEANTDRLVTTNTTQFRPTSGDNKFMGFMYSPGGTEKSTSKKQAQTNETDSIIKTELQDWYQTNIIAKDLDKYVGDELFCNDRTTPGKKYSGVSDDTGYGFGTNITYYGSYVRLRKNKLPQFTCPQQNDAFTMEDTVHGNGDLSMKVGLITADELVTAGALYGTANKNFYLFKGTAYWTMSPSDVSTYTNGSTKVQQSLMNELNNTGTFITISGSNKIGLVPVINLSYDFASTLTGTGTSTDPYRQRNENEVVVTLDAGDIEINPNSKILESGNVYGELPIPTKTGYSFGGWFTGINGTGTQVTENTIVTNKENHTLYANMLPNNYTVTLNGNGITSEPASKTVVYNSTYGELPVLEREGYTYNGWYTATSGGTKIEEDTKVTITANQTLYARWTANKYTITYDPNTGTCSTIEKTVTYNSTYGTLATPTKEGYTFNGWFTERTGGTKITSSTKVTTASDHTLYAQWSLKNFTVTLNANGGTNNSGITSKTVYWGERYGNLPTLYRDGYEFEGWWTSSSGGTQVTASTTVNLTANQTLYAHWSANNYTVYLDGAGEYVSPSSMTVAFGSTYGTLPTLTNSEKDFLGWFTDPTGGTEVKSTTKVSINSNHTLYAHWQYKVGPTGTLATLKITPKSGTPSFGSNATSNEGVYQKQDDYGTSYYYRGAVTNNHVYFANKYWRIIRINGDGSIRMIYSGTSGAYDNILSSPDADVCPVKVPWNTTNNNDVKYTGYMYGGNNGTASTSSSQAQTNSVAANVKTKLESWYRSNIYSSYDKYVGDETFCNDRNIISGSGYGNTVTYFGGTQRYYYNNNWVTISSSSTGATFVCHNKSDAFTKSDSTHGNAKLGYKVGLITGDEVIAAGGSTSNNTSFYLYKPMALWTMTPAGTLSYQNTETPVASMIILSSSGRITHQTVENDMVCAMPVINISPTYAVAMTGSGTTSDPYKLK